MFHKTQKTLSVFVATLIAVSSLVSIPQAASAANLPEPTSADSSSNYVAVPDARVRSQSTVTFDGNGVAGSPDFSNSENVAPGATSLSGTEIVLPNRGTLEDTADRPNFAGWNTKADGSGDSYPAGSTYKTTGTSDHTLYAQWHSGETYIQYDLNGATGGVPAVRHIAEGGSRYEMPDPRNKGYVKSGYSDSKAGWSEDPSGKGRLYWYTDTSKTFPIPHPTSTRPTITLYLILEGNPQTLVYKQRNGAADMEQVTYTGANTRVGVSAPLRPGWVFGGWTFDETNQGTKYERYDSLPEIAPAAANNKIYLYALWIPQRQYVYYDSNGGSDSPARTSTLSGTVIEESDAPASITKFGYTFSSWALDSAGTTPVVFPYTLPDALTDHQHTFYAQWTGLPQKLVYDSNGGGSAPAGQDTLSGALITLPEQGDMAKPGYTFAGWSTSKTGSRLVSPYTIPAAAADTVNTLYALWLPVAKTLVFDPNGGGTGGPADRSTTANTQEVLPEKGSLTRDGHIFDGWSATKDGVKLVSPYTIPAEDGTTTTLYARWLAVSSQIVVYNANGGSGAPADVETSSSAPFTFSTKEPTKLGYVFKGWTLDSANAGTVYVGGDTYTIPVAEDGTVISFYAKWAPNAQTISYDLNGGSGTPTGGTLSGSSTQTGATITLPSQGTLARHGYVFGGWSASRDGAKLSGTTYTIPGAAVNNNNVLYVRWIGILQTVSYNANGGAGAPTEAETFTGAAFTLSDTKPTKFGYDFAGWTLDAENTGTVYNADTGTYTIPDAPELTNNVFYAKWTGLSQKVVYNANGGTNTTSLNTPPTTASGATLTLSTTAPSRTGYTFTGWSLSADGDTLTTYKVPDAALNTVNTFYAKWVAKAITIRYLAGSFTGLSNIPAEGNTVSNAIFVLSDQKPTKAGYTFIDWRDAITGISNNRWIAGASYSVGATTATHRNLYAYMTLSSQKVVYDSKGGTGGPAEAGTTSDATFTLSATKPTKSGYTFDGWTLDAANAGTVYAAGTGTYKIPLANEGTANTFYAKWTGLPQKIIYHGVGSNRGTPPETQTVKTGDIVKVSDNTGSLAKDGAKFLGWTDDLGVDYLVGDDYTVPARETAFYPKWESDGFSGGGGGGGGSAVVDTSSTATDVVTPPAITLNGVSPTVAVITDESSKTIRATSGDVAMELSLAPKTVVEEGTNQIQLTQNSLVSLSGSGLQPGLKLDLYVFSTPTLIGSTVVDSSGRFTIDSNIPKSVVAGQHKLQVLTGDRSIITSFPLNVSALGSKSKSVSYFSGTSTKLTDLAKTKLSGFVDSKIVGKKVASVTVDGFASAKQKSVALARAKATAEHLKSLGVTAKIVARAKTAKTTTSQNGKVEVFVNYAK